MKIIRNLQKLVLLSIILFFSKNAYATNWEVGFRTINQDSNAVSVTVYVYTYNSSTGNFDEHDHGTTKNVFEGFGDPTINGGFDINSTDQVDPTINPLPAINRLYIRIGNKYFKLNRTSGGYGDVKFLYNGNFSCYSNTSGYTVTGPFTWTEYDITLKNDFGSDRASVSGNILFNSSTLTNVGYTGITLSREAGTFPHSVSGQDNQYLGSYYRKWRKWNDNTENISKSLPDAQDYNNEIATYTRKCNVTLTNDFDAGGSGGTIYLNSSPYGSPSSQNLYEDLEYTIQAYSTTIDCIYYTFDHWEFNSSSIGSTNPLTNWSPPAHGILSAVFTPVKPTNTYRTQRYNDGEIGEDIEITWNAHPLDNNGITKYDIYRKVKYNGVMGSEYHIGTRTANGSANYSFTDTSYQVADGTTMINCFYDVRAYYSPSGTYADPEFISIYADCLANIVNNDSFETASLEAATAEEAEPIAETKLGNFPNPFNPTTNINYSLAETGFVSLKVYNVLGKEVATLVNEVKSVGQHSVSFNAANLPSGVYIYTLQTSNQVITKKMSLMK